MVSKKERVDDDSLKVKAYNIKVKNIKKVKDLSLKKDGGNESKTINKIIEAY